MGGVLVGGTVLSYLLMLRAETVLHASAVDVGGRAVGFVGSSGMGKTTLATLMCRDGGLLVTDDVLRLRRGPDGNDLCRSAPRSCACGRQQPASPTSSRRAVSHRATADDRRALSVPAATEEGVPLSRC